MALPEEHGFHGGVPKNTDNQPSSAFAVATNDPRQAKGKNILQFPNDLVSGDDEGREVVRFSVRKRADLDDIPHSVYLFQPPGFSLADTAGYQGNDFGLYGRSSLKAVDSMMEANQGGVTVRDFAVGIGSNIIDAFKPEGEDGGAGLDITSVLLGKLGTAGKSLAMKQGRILSPYTNLTYTGPQMRGFTFQYKMIAETKDESDTIKDIENMFRKYIYPEETAQGFILKYPPYFMIQFLKAYVDGESENGELKYVENPYLPFLHLSYLQSMTCTYNSSTNVFHEGGQPVEVDLSLTFVEASMQTRDSLYEKGDSLEHKSGRPRTGITEITGDQVGDVAEDALETGKTIIGSNE